MPSAIDPSAPTERIAISPPGSRAGVNRLPRWVRLALLAGLPLMLGAAPVDPGFQAITSRVSHATHAELCEQMTAWIAAHPTDPNAGRGLVWMGQLVLIDSNYDQAYAYFQRAEHEYASTEWGPHGMHGRANIDVYEHRYQQAIDTYAQLAARPESYWQYVGKTGRREAEDERVRFIAYVLLAGALLAWVGVRLALVKQRWPPPEELVWTAPILLVMLVEARTQAAPEARAVVTLVLGSIALLWANGAFLRERPPGRRWPLEAVLALAQAAALLYCTVISSHIWVKFAETLASGAER